MPNAAGTCLLLPQQQQPGLVLALALNLAVLELLMARGLVYPHLMTAVKGFPGVVSRLWLSPAILVQSHLRETKEGRPASG